MSVPKELRGGSARLSRRRMSITGLAMLLAASLVAATASAATMTLATFDAFPVSYAMPELVWSNHQLYQGVGAVGTNFGVPGPGDGQTQASKQLAPGLLVQTPYSVPGIPGSHSVGEPLMPGTAFYDCSLLLTAPLTATGTATAIGSTLVQPLSQGAFEIWSTDPLDAVADVDNSTLLLRGTISNAFIVALAGTDVGSVLSADVTYTSGAILNAAGVSTGHGSFSWTLAAAYPLFSLDQDGYLSTFTANSNGQFTATDVPPPPELPEPGTLVLLAIGGLGFCGYVIRRNRAK